MKLQTDGATMSCGLIAHPAGHSMSPLLHNSLAARMGINMHYQAFDVAPENLRAALNGADALGFLGLNITVPYKEEVLPLLSHVDEEARRLGAVNTLYRSPGREGFFGTNTDILGLKDAFDTTGVSLKGRKLIVIGAGGAARSVCTMLVRENVAEIWLLNRTKERAEELAADLLETTGFDRVHVLALDEYDKIPVLPDEKYDCCQCTSVGMYPYTEHSPVEDPAFFERIEGVLDVIYRPVETKFLKLARKAGAKTYNGLKLLMCQAVRAFELWHNCKVPPEIFDEVFAGLERTLSHKTSIALIGFMGSGKTTVSRLLAERLGEQRLDSDSEIERRVNTTVRDIIAVRGEGAFRAIETRILRELAGEEREPFVLSTGGGVPMKEENRAILHEIGTVIWLKTSPEEIYRRLKDDDSRPLLQTGDKYQTIVDMGNARAEDYGTAADVIITTDGKTPEMITEEIIHIIEDREAA
ncbi:MAG: shikimate dehydrogenase [Lachnospiraceae bacterium]|nr:shikimate dehydrogenase [Lachnospiraceae bacterium]